MGLIMNEKKSLTYEVARRYRKSNKAGKTAILNEFTADTGYNRKYANRILMHERKEKIRYVKGRVVVLKIAHNRHIKRIYKKYYDAPVEKVVLHIWTDFNLMCGKLLTPLFKANLECFAAEPSYEIDLIIKRKLSKISVSTVERMLKSGRKKLKLKGTCTTKPGITLKSQIPIRVFFNWNERLPGFFEIDTVSHDGSFASGEYCFTLTVTDVFSGWTELRALLNKAAKWVTEAMSDIYSSIPFEMKGADSDNGSEFINETMLKWCIEHKVTFTRNRPYKKNDNCFVEQKNGACVRKTVGYRRYDGAVMLANLNRVYDAYCPLLNYFYPCVKIISKERVGAKVKKVYEKPRTPFERLVERPLVSSEVKQELLKRKSNLNLMELKHQLDNALDILMGTDPT